MHVCAWLTPVGDSEFGSRTRANNILFCNMHTLYFQRDEDKEENEYRQSVKNRDMIKSSLMIFLFSYAAPAPSNNCLHICTDDEKIKVHSRRYRAV